MQPPSESCKAFPSVYPVCHLAERWRGMPSIPPKGGEVHSGGLSWPASLSHVSLQGGTSPLITVWSKQEKKKTVEIARLTCCLSPSSSIAEAGSPGTLQWHLHLGPDTAASGPSPAPLLCAGASSHFPCMGREQERASRAVALFRLAGSKYKPFPAKCSRQ